MVIKTRSDKLSDLFAFEKSNIEEILLEKGGDYFSSFMYSISPSGEKRNCSVTSKDFEIWYVTMRDMINQNNFDEPSDVVLMLFSRQQPEMENTDAEEQPYTTENGRIAIHGTIYNDKEIADKRNLDIKVDTEVFKFLEIENTDIKGTFAAIEITSDLEIFIRENGLKVWHGVFNNGYELLGHVIATTDLSFLNREITNVDEFNPFFKYSRRTLMVSFSGGMDIALSTYKILKTNQYSKLVLNYFNWGSNAAQAEIKTMEKFKDFYSSVFRIDVEINIIEAQNYFKDYFEINDSGSKIAEDNAVGDEAETESPIAYVPYRNSQFALLLSSIAEEKQMVNVDLLFGLNLSEGMVFMDNSEGWLKAITDVVKYGGKDFSITGTYRVLAPYFTRTKTNMLKEFKMLFDRKTLEILLDLSFSCYYPKEDGTACGQCGSCILRQKALKKIN
jgi:7-cyano-7-deazaguanine synthase in queuosine biosynthesis